MRDKERKMLEQEVASLWDDVKNVLQNEQYKDGYLQAISDVVILLDQFGRGKKQ